VRRAFVYLHLFFNDCRVSEIAEGIFEHCTRAEVLDLLRPADAVLQLLRRVTLNDQEPATDSLGDLLLRNPITGICCARAASGKAATAPPSSVMKSRRLN
jgi:hypothetical protein